MLDDVIYYLLLTNQVVALYELRKAKNTAIVSSNDSANKYCSGFYSPFCCQFCLFHSFSYAYLFLENFHRKTVHHMLFCNCCICCTSEGFFLFLSTKNKTFLGNYSSTIQLSISQYYQ